MFFSCLKLIPGSPNHIPSPNNKQTKDKNQNKQNPNKTKIHKQNKTTKNYVVSLCLLSTPGHGACLFLSVVNIPS